MHLCNQSLANLTQLAQPQFLEVDTAGTRGSMLPATSTSHSPFPQPCSPQAKHLLHSASQWREGQDNQITMLTSLRSRSGQRREGDAESLNDTDSPSLLSLSADGCLSGLVKQDQSSQRKLPSFLCHTTEAGIMQTHLPLPVTS